MLSLYFLAKYQYTVIYHNLQFKISRIIKAKDFLKKPFGFYESLTLQHFHFIKLTLKRHQLLIGAVFHTVSVRNDRYPVRLPYG